MKQKLLCMLFVLAILLSALPVTAAATDGSDYGIELSFASRNDSEVLEYPFSKIYAKRISNDIQITVVYSVSSDREMNVFSPPDGEFYKERASLSCADTVTQVTLTTAEIISAPSMTIKIWPEGQEDEAAWAFIEKENYFVLEEMALAYDGSSDYGAELQFTARNDNNEVEYPFTKIYAKSVASGIQITVMFNLTVPSKMNLFSPPQAEYFQKWPPISISDTIVQATIPADQILAAPAITFKIWPINDAGKPAWAIINGDNYTALRELALSNVQFEEAGDGVYSYHVAGNTVCVRNGTAGVVVVSWYDTSTGRQIKTELCSGSDSAVISVGKSDQYAVIYAVEDSEWRPLLQKLEVNS